MELKHLIGFSWSYDIQNYRHTYTFTEEGLIFRVDGLGEVAKFNCDNVSLHPFKDTIESQYKKRELLFNNNILPKFELITYKNVQSVGNDGPHDNWYESLKVMKEDISKIDFDIALLGCGGYGLPLVNFIKTEMVKSAIYIGGGLQILFGIKGKRWNNHDVISKLYNEHWVSPSSGEISPHSHKIEGGCYW